MAKKMLYAAASLALLSVAPSKIHGFELHSAVFDDKKDDMDALKEAGWRETTSEANELAVAEDEAPEVDADALTVANERITELESELKTAKTDSGGVDEINAKLTAAEADRDDLNAKLKAAEKDLKAANAKVKKLEAEAAKAADAAS